MRKIEVKRWEAKDPEGNVVNDSTLILLNVVLSSKEPSTMPRGLDQFRLYNRLSKAFEKAEKSGILTLEEIDYAFLKKALEEDVPSAWGLNTNIVEAIDSFLNAQEVKEDG